MKIKLATTLCLIAPIFCLAQKDFVRFSGKIENRNGDSLTIFSNTKVLKTIIVDKNGVFSDTLKVEQGLYAMADNVEMTMIFLKNGFDFKVKFDAKKFDETLHYEGTGGGENNFLAKQILAGEEFDIKTESLEDESQFAALLNDRKDKQMSELNKGNYDPDFKKAEAEYIMHSTEGAKAKFAKKVAISKLKNAPSPGFAYENAAGGVTKLEDFKGKYVFIDIWATWCKPCIGEIPFLKTAEERYKGRDIVFVSLSVDYQKNHDKWKSFVAEKNLSGVQLIADKDWKSQFIKDYAISAIPRFILIDPQGKVMEPDAPRPSSKELTEVLDKLLL